MKYDHQIKSEEGFFMLNKVREICRTLPEAVETMDGFGCTTFRIRNKSFLRMSESEKGVQVSFKSDQENQSILLQGENYIKAPYIGHHGWVALNKEVPVNWNELGVLLSEAYLRTAPKEIRKQII